MSNQAFIDGFVKRAVEYGYTEEQGIELYKQAVDGVAPRMPSPSRASLIGKAPLDKPVMDPFTANPFNLPPPTDFKPAKMGEPGTAGMSAKALDARNVAQELNARLGNSVVPLQAGTASAKPSEADLNDRAGYRRTR